MQTPLKIGVFGTGHLGKIHLKCIQEIEEFGIVGFYDPDEIVKEAVVRAFNVTAFDTPEALMDAVDVIDIVSPTPTHAGLMREGLIHGKHVFVEKPVTGSVEEARTLRDLARQNQLKVQVGHVERYNPAFRAAQQWEPKPMFIEGHRLAQFNPRGMDVSVVHDLMIHDLDIVRLLIPAKIASIQANAVSVIGRQHDICNARITFENGAVANLTASRISLKSMRKLRLFQQDAYMSIDFLEKELEVIRLYAEQPGQSAGMTLPVSLNGDRRWIQRIKPDIPVVNAIREELFQFADAILRDRTPDVTLDDGITSLETAQQIFEAIEQSAKNIRYQA